MNELNWTEEQNTIVRNLIAEEIEKARLCHKFIPELKVAEDTRSVPADEYDAAKNIVDDIKTIPLVEVAAAVTLTKLQAEDADLSGAILLIRRAANRIAHAHDMIVFSGQPNIAPGTRLAIPGITLSGGSKNNGLFASPRSIDIVPTKAGGSYGEVLIAKIADALIQLETDGYIGSYVLVLGHNLFIDANTPSPGSLVLPTDRLEKLLGGGPVYRSSVFDKDHGLLISLGGEPMDRAIAVAPRFEFLRIGNNENRECRLFERFALRLKEKESVIKLERK